jgi:hypothetical protein
MVYKLDFCPCMLMNRFSAVVLGIRMGMDDCDAIHHMGMYEKGDTGRIEDEKHWKCNPQH